jgi:hypothetical protein
MKVIKVWDADIYRDGGSYGVCFDSDDGHWYELFLRTRAFEGAAETHYAPVVYFEGCNSGVVVEQLTWSEAKEFVASLNYSSSRFSEFVKIISNEGRRA